MGKIIARQLRIKLANIGIMAIDHIGLYQLGSKSDNDTRSGAESSFSPYAYSNKGVATSLFIGTSNKEDRNASTTAIFPAEPERETTITGSRSLKYS